MCTPDFLYAFANSAGANIQPQNTTPADYGAPATGLIQPSATPTNITAPAQISVAPLGSGPNYGLSRPAAQPQGKTPMQQFNDWYQSTSDTMNARRVAADPSAVIGNPNLQAWVDQQNAKQGQNQQPNSIDGTGATNPLDPNQQQPQTARSNLQAQMDPYYGNAWNPGSAGGT